MSLSPTHDPTNKQIYLHLKRADNADGSYRVGIAPPSETDRTFVPRVVNGTYGGCTCPVVSDGYERVIGLVPGMDRCTSERWFECVCAHAYVPSLKTDIVDKQRQKPALEASESTLY